MDYLISGLRLDPQRKIRVRQDQDAQIPSSDHRSKSIDKKVLVDNAKSLNLLSESKAEKSKPLGSKTKRVYNASRFDYDKADRLREEADLERKLIDEEIDYQLKVKEQQLISQKRQPINKSSSSSLPMLNVKKIRNSSNNTKRNTNTSGSINSKRVVSLDYINEAKLALNNLLNLVDDHDQPKSASTEGIKADRLRIQRAKDQLSKQTDEKIAKDWNELKYQYFKAHKGELTPMAFNNILKNSNEFKRQVDGGEKGRYVSDSFVDNVKTTSSKSPQHRFFSEPAAQPYSASQKTAQRQSPLPRQSPINGSKKTAMTPGVSPTKLKPNPEKNMKPKQERQEAHDQRRKSPPRTGSPPQKISQAKIEETGPPVRKTTARVETIPDSPAIVDVENIPHNRVAFDQTDLATENYSDHEEHEEYDEEDSNNILTDVVLEEPLDSYKSVYQQEDPAYSGHLVYATDQMSQDEYELDHLVDITSSSSVSNYQIEYDDFMALQEELNRKSQIIRSLNFELEESEAENQDLIQRNHELVERLIGRTEGLRSNDYENDNFSGSEEIDFHNEDDDDDDNDNDNDNDNDTDSYSYNYGYEDELDEFPEEIDIDDLCTTKLLNSDITPRGSIILYN